MARAFGRSQAPYVALTARFLGAPGVADAPTVATPFPRAGGTLVSRRDPGGVSAPRRHPVHHGDEPLPGGPPGDARPRRPSLVPSEAEWTSSRMGARRRPDRRSPFWSRSTASRPRPRPPRSCWACAARARRHPSLSAPGSDTWRSASSPTSAPGRRSTPSLQLRRALEKPVAVAVAMALGTLVHARRRVRRGDLRDSPRRRASRAPGSRFSQERSPRRAPTSLSARRTATRSGCENAGSSRSLFAVGAGLGVVVSGQQPLR